MATDLSNTVMRTVSFVERIEVEFHGNVVTQAMILEDVDNDMGNELIVGNIDGQISIFKGDSPHAWKKSSVSGMLTCMAVGKIHLPKKNSLVCMTAEGWCHLFDVTAQSSVHSVLATDEEPQDNRMIKPIFSQELPANARVMCLADIDSDGHIEMVIGYADRVVRAFRWQELPNSDSGHFVLLQKWQLAGQIGSITINYNREEQPELMVSQPGATFVTLQVKPAFRHIKSDSCLDRLGNSGTSSFRTNVERSGSFVSTVTGRKHSDSPRGENYHLDSFSPRQTQQRGVTRKSEPCSSKSDILSNSSGTSKQVNENLPTSSVSTEVFPASSSAQGEQVSRPSKMSSVGSAGERESAGTHSSEHLALRTFNSESCTDKTQDVSPKTEKHCDASSKMIEERDANSGADISTTDVRSVSYKRERYGGSKEDNVSGSGSCEPAKFSGTEVSLTTRAVRSSSNGSDKPFRPPLTAKTSVESVEGNDPLVGSQGSPRPSNTTNSSPRDSQDGGFERSIGKMSHILDGSFDDDVFKPSIMYHPLAYMQMRNKDTSTVIVGGIKQGRQSPLRGRANEEAKPRATYYALATLDGSLILVENNSILWSLQVDHYLFALSKLDVTGNGKEEVVCCSWNGQTYIVNHSKEIVRYQFPNSVAAFCAGYFSLRDGYNAPCFVYAGFNNRIYIYPNIALPRVESTNLLKVMGRMDEGRELLKKLGISENDVESIRQLYYYCLYGQSSKRQA